jgi:transcription elongation factor Elf1
MSAHAMLHQKDNCVRSLERKSKSVPEEPDKEVVRKQTKCPKCGHINTTDCQTECPECSIIYSQYQLVVKKAFDNTLAIIGRNGLETAGEELNALAIRYPSVKATCDQYSAFIDHAIKKHLAGNNELARDYLDRFVKKHPVLKDSVANYFKEKEVGNNNDSSSELTEIVTQDVAPVIDDNKIKENKRRALIACSILFVMMFASMLINKDDYTDLIKKKYSASIIPAPERRSVSPVISPPVSTGYTEAFLIVMNENHGNVCKIETSGIFSRTLKVDWTQNTNKLLMLKVFAEIGDAKVRLYEEGVRYFQFPNNICRYNVIDWKTGEKESISDRAPYCFTD